MKIYNDVLTQDILEECYHELWEKRRLNCWRSSLLTWPQDVLVNVTGNCLSTSVSDDLTLQLENSLKNILPPYDRLGMTFHIWQSNSGISSHNDSNYKFGATVYLNVDWHVNDGGLFVWVDGKTFELKVYLPSYNTLVLNDEKEDHLVTPVTKNSSNRYTIQIFGN